MEHREKGGVLSPRLEALSRAYAQEMGRPTGGDKIIAAYAKAAEQEIHHEFGEFLENSFEFRDSYRPPIEAHHAVQLTLRVLQKHMLKHYPHIYPTRFTQTGLNFLGKEYAEDTAKQRFWVNLKAGYDYFEHYKKLEPVVYDPIGKYVHTN